MELCTVGDTVRKGLCVHYSDAEEPFIAVAPHLSLQMSLDEHLTDYCRWTLAQPEVWVEERQEWVQPRVTHITAAALVFDKTVGLTTVVLGVDVPPSTQAIQRGEEPPPSNQLLLHLETHAGEGGLVAMLPPRTDRKGIVNKKYQPFPPTGVQYLGSVEDAAAAQRGSHALNEFLLLKVGARFAVERTGDLRDQNGTALPHGFEMLWTGTELEMVATEVKPRPESWAVVARDTLAHAAQRAQQWTDIRASMNC